MNRDGTVNKIRLFLVLALAGTVGVLDQSTSPAIHWGFLYLCPVMAASYFFGYGGFFIVPVCLAIYHWSGIIQHGEEGYDFHPGNTWLEFAGMVATVIFISRLVRVNSDLELAGRSLESSLHQKEVIFDTVDGGIMLLDSQLDVLDVNPVMERLLDLRLLDTLGHPVTIQNLDIGLVRFFKALDGATEVTRERIDMSYPEKRIVEVVASPLSSLVDGQAGGWVVTLEDITDLVHTHQALLSRTHTLAVQDTRSRLARDLHDNLAQILATINLRLGMLRQASKHTDNEITQVWDRVEELLARALKDIRQNIWELRPISLETMEFVPALQHYLDDMSNMGLLKGHLKVEGTLNLDSERQVLLFYIIQEALMNAQKHARARNAYVTIQCQPSRILVEVRDDGEGFDMDRHKARTVSKSYGMTDMKDRASLMGGTFHIYSAPGHGTRINVEIPVTQEAVHVQ